MTIIALFFHDDVIIGSFCASKPPFVIVNLKVVVIEDG